MPEGHSIHRLARQFNDVFTGETVAVSSPQGRFSSGAALLTGGRIETSFAHGKHLFVKFDSELYLNVHLGIYGAFTFGGDSYFRGASSIGAPRKIGEQEIAANDFSPEETERYGGAPEPKPTVRARIVSKHGWADLIGPTVCRVLTDQEMRAVRARLGPDPLNADSDPEQFLAAAAKTARPIGVVLMDQKVISGVGNIFRAESLFRQEIDPLRPAKSLSRRNLKALWDDNQKLLERGVRVGRIITTEPEDRPGIDENQAWPDYANYVYHRQGQPCPRCETTIAMSEVAGRKLYWCPGCQH